MDPDNIHTCVENHFQKGSDVISKILFIFKAAILKQSNIYGCLFIFTAAIFVVIFYVKLPAQCAVVSVYIFCMATLIVSEE